MEFLLTSVQVTCTQITTHVFLWRDSKVGMYLFWECCNNIMQGHVSDVEVGTTINISNQYSAYTVPGCRV